MVTTSIKTTKMSGFVEADIVETGLPTLPLQDIEYLGVPHEPRVSFLDVNPHYTNNQEPLLLRDEAAIRQKIRNVLATPVGSSYFEPEYGSMLPYRIFDPITSASAWLLRSDTAIALNRWLGGLISVDMARVSVEVILGTPDSEGYEIYVPYTINRTAEATSYKFKVTR